MPYRKAPLQKTLRRLRRKGGTHNFPFPRYGSRDNMLPRHRRRSSPSPVVDPEGQAYTGFGGLAYTSHTGVAYNSQVTVLP